MSLNNETYLSPSSIVIVLDLIQQNFVSQLPLIITILGLLGFIGNSLTFLHPTLRKNSFSMYTLSGSFVDIINLFVNLFPIYLSPLTGNVQSTIPISWVCKVRLFVLVFLPQLSMNLLIMSLIDRYACTHDLTSRIRLILQLKMVPRLIGITILISSVSSIYSPILNDIVSSYGCDSTQPIINGLLYILIHGIITPLVMLILVLLTYKKFKQNRHRVMLMTREKRIFFRNHFITTAFVQVFVTSFFILQWIFVYWYFTTTQYKTKSAELRAIDSFLLSLTNNLYYIINIKSFYLSTLTSRVFRKTFMTVLTRLVHKTITLFYWKI
ncbi:hypothetical protein I4U23_001449 [Adineta vaga]|nr:hypothetical protein I4U23_001449 [Adineta vaga]